MPKAEKSNKKTFLQNETNKLLGKVKAEPPASSNVEKNQETANEAKLRLQVKMLQDELLQEKRYKKTLLQNNANKVLGKANAEQSTSSNVEKQQETGNEAKLRLELKLLQEKFNKYASENTNESESTTTTELLINMPNESPTDTQLYGENYLKEEMVLLCNNIYCRKTVYDSAVGASFKASHLARRLLEGVFKKETILECTFSGQAPKAQGEERRNRKYDCLNGHARKAIIEFCNEYAKKRGWTPQSQYELNRTMTQKIGEIKRQYKRN